MIQPDPEEQLARKEKIQSTVSAASARRSAKSPSASPVTVGTTSVSGPARGGTNATRGATAPSRPDESRTTVAADLVIPAAQSDDPSNLDLLSRALLVECLAGMIRSPDQTTPLTIALFGDWGAGKTTVMRLLKAALESDRRAARVLFADFNGWSYEHTENTAAALAQEVKRGLFRDVASLQRLRIALRYSVIRHRSKVLSSLASLVLAVAAAALAMMEINTGTSLRLLMGAGLGAVAATGLIVFIGQVVSLSRVLFKHPLANELVSYLALPKYEEHLGLTEALRRDIEDLCRIRLGEAARRPTRRLVLFVDDLDRCSRACIVRTLEAVRLIMDLTNVVVIIGVDHRVALRAIGEHYAELADEERSKEMIARDYLGKIIQIPIRLRDPGQEDIKRFISSGLFGQPAEGDTAPESVERGERVAQLMREGPEETRAFVEFTTGFNFANPRQIRRLRNSYRLLKALRADSGWAQDALMGMLFWQEYIRTLAPDVAEQAELALASGGALPVRLPSELETRLRSVTANRYPDLADIAVQVVMPRSRKGPRAVRETDSVAATSNAAAS